MNRTSSVLGPVPAAVPPATSATPPAVHGHPLELIPYFRRFACTPARDLLYTLIWNFLIGTGFVVFGALFSYQVPSLRVFAIYLVIANLIGFTIHALYMVGRLLGLESGARNSGLAVKVIYFSVIPTIGVMVGFQISLWIFDLGFRNWLKSPGWIVSVATTSVIISGILSSIFFWREREARAQAALEREQLRAERIEREATLANLRALQAQIEPHFLFNTLANVTSLVDRDPATAKRMLESFIRFLRASLAATRMETTTLGAEAELIAAYLDVLQIRMGSRLRYRIDVPADLESVTLAPMLLQPVVENAIRHGLEPKVDGGDLTFTARRNGGDVIIEIRDTGAGFASTTRGGVGLTNLRDRLRGLYGERAALGIGEDARGGAAVTLRIPG
jgi:sensor histidine kinase YesM